MQNTTFNRIRRLLSVKKAFECTFSAQPRVSAERAGDGAQCWLLLTDSLRLLQHPENVRKRTAYKTFHALARRGDEKLRDVHVRWDDALLDVAEAGLLLEPGLLKTQHLEALDDKTAEYFMTHHSGATLVDARVAAEEYAAVQESFGVGIRQQPAWDGERRHARDRAHPRGAGRPRAGRTEARHLQRRWPLPGALHALRSVLRRTTRSTRPRTLPRTACAASVEVEIILRDTTCRT